MSYSYTLRNIQTGTVEYTGLTAGEVYRITGISSQRVSRYAAAGKVYGNTWKVSLDEDDYSEFWTDEMCMKWDCVRKMVLGGLKFGKGSYEEKLERWRKRCKQNHDVESGGKAKWESLRWQQ